MEKSGCCPRGQRQAAAVALRAACSETPNKRATHTIHVYRFGNTGAQSESPSPISLLYFTRSNSGTCVFGAAPPTSCENSVSRSNLKSRHLAGPGSHIDFFRPASFLLGFLSKLRHGREGPRGLILFTFHLAVESRNNLDSVFRIAIILKFVIALRGTKALLSTGVFLSISQ